MQSFVSKFGYCADANANDGDSKRTDTTLPEQVKLQFCQNKESKQSGRQKLKSTGAALSVTLN